MTYLRFFLHLARCFVFCSAILLIALIWLPEVEVYMPAHDSVMIQSEENNLIGFVVQYHSKVGWSYYAYKTVALSGNNQVGYTPTIDGYHGMLNLNYPGFIMLCCLTMLVVLFLLLFLKYTAREIYWNKGSSLVPS